MPRTFSAPVAAAVVSDSFELPTVVLIELASGDTISMTDWDKPLLVNLDGEGIKTYAPNKFEGISTFSAQINAPIDDSELILLVDDDVFVADDVRRGRYDNATVTVGYVVPGSPNEPTLHRRYDVGQTRVDGVRITFELMGPEKRLEQPTGRTLTANCIYAFGDKDCGMQTRVNAWEANTAYTADAIVKQTGFAVVWWKVITAGTSAATEPVWPIIPGSTIADGTVVWEFMAARRVVGQVSSVVSRRVFSGTMLAILADWFGEGHITFTTGANAGDRRRIKTDNGSGTLTLHIGTFDDLQIGDWFEAVAGCRKRLTEDCIGKWDNANNSRTQTLRFGGMPHLAPEDVTATAPKGDNEDE